MDKIKIDYKPENVGKKIISSRGNSTTQRKYHMTDKEIEEIKKKFKKNTIDVSQEIKDKAGPYFFNPYRYRGVYYSQLQALYLLGANEWHTYQEVRKKMEEFASTVIFKKRRNRHVYDTNVWKEFQRKTAKIDSVTSKDIFGRINENMIFFQRLTKHHPSGYKLYQVKSAVDIKKVSKEGFSNGIFYYRLSTYDKQEDAFPIKDNSNYFINKKRGRKKGSKNKKELVEI
jgi:hypothetical protein